MATQPQAWCLCVTAIVHIHRYELGFTGNTFPPVSPSYIVEAFCSGPRLSQRCCGTNEPPRTCLSCVINQPPRTYAALPALALSREHNNIEITLNTGSGWKQRCAELMQRSNDASYSNTSDHFALNILLSSSPVMHTEGQSGSSGFKNCAVG